jgi:hypothetical protein
MKTGRLRLSFPDQGRIDAAEIGHYLFLFRGAYAAALPLVRHRPVRAASTQLEFLEARLRSKLSRLTVKRIDSLFSRTLGHDAPTPERIGHESPLEIIMSGMLIALTLAVILSGGTVKFDVKSAKGEAILPPIGDGIRKLRQALTKAPGARLAYGVRPKRIILSTAEFTELMKHDPTTKTRGGFQQLLIGMQCRVNRITHELELSDHEMDMILRHGRNPGKGGWQSSIKRIFGDHFKLEQ